MNILANITDKIRRMIGGKPPNALNRLQAYLNEGYGGATMACPRCRGIVTPIFNVSPQQAELVAMACTACHGVTILDERGAIDFRSADSSPTHATIH